MYKIEKRTAQLYTDLFAGLGREYFCKRAGAYLRRTGLDEGWFEGKACLDVGSGAGFAAYALSLVKNTRVSAMDISRQCLSGLLERTQGKKVLCVSPRRSLSLLKTHHLISSIATAYCII